MISNISHGWPTMWWLENPRENEGCVWTLVTSTWRTPKYSYPFLNIDRLINSAYSRYTKIKMNPLGAPKSAFINNTCTYYYEGMPFNLKNIGGTYQQLMDVVCRSILLYLFYFRNIKKNKYLKIIFKWLRLNPKYIYECL